MHFFHIAMNANRELPAHLALSRHPKLDMRICSRKSLVEAIPVNEVTKLPLQLNLRDKIGGRRDMRLILNGACLYLEGEISE